MRLLERTRHPQRLRSPRACAAFDLSLEREGDVAVIAQSAVCAGGAERAHDLSGLAGHRLRTHGGRSEARVPFLPSGPVTAAYRQRAQSGTLVSWQLFDQALNGTGRVEPLRGAVAGTAPR
jgi:phosphonoacetate hydrolase